MPYSIKSKMDKIRNLIRPGTFEFILKEEVPCKACILPGRFVLAIKSNINREITHKAIFVIGEFRDKLKPFMGQ